MSTEVILNDAKSYIINNIKQQKEALIKDKGCSVILISGAPGIGKSDLMTQVATDLGMGLNTQYLGTMLLEQFGMPLPTTDVNATFQKWSNPEFYSTENLRVHPKSPSGDDGIILFMDDIHLATKTIQTYFFQLLTYRSLHNKKMPRDFVMVAAGNRSTDRAGAQAIMAPIVNRFFVLDVKADTTDWVTNFAIPYGITPSVLSFLQMYPEMLQSEPLESKPWASPRSWTYFSDALDQYSKDHSMNVDKYLMLASGHVGLEYANKFVEYVELFMKWNSDDFLIKGVDFPDFSTISKIEVYSLMSVVIAGFMKTFKANNYDVKNETVTSQLKVLKIMFDQLTQKCVEIVPLGLRSIILSGDMKSKQALVYGELMKDNKLLLEAAKKILSVK